MMKIRRAANRGHADHDWLSSWHSFSFADYYDPHHMGVSVLRVINDDTVDVGAGFPTHPHRDMEIISYVLEGALEHRDSMGNGSTIRPGDVQRMSAGTGVTHSEYNASKDKPVRFLQIWIVPSQAGLKPGYEQRSFEAGERRNQWCLVGSADGRNDSVTIHQDVQFHTTLLDAGKTLDYTLVRGRCAYLHVARGDIQLGSDELSSGDGVRVDDEVKIQLHGRSDGEVLLFDLPAE